MEHRLVLDNIFCKALVHGCSQPAFLPAALQSSIQELLSSESLLSSCAVCWHLWIKRIDSTLISHHHCAVEATRSLVETWQSQYTWGEQPRNDYSQSLFLFPGCPGACLCSRLLCSCTKCWQADGRALVQLGLAPGALGWSWVGLRAHLGRRESPRYWKAGELFHCTFPKGW